MLLGEETVEANETEAEVLVTIVPVLVNPLTNGPLPVYLCLIVANPREA